MYKRIGFLLSASFVPQNQQFKQNTPSLKNMRQNLILLTYKTQIV